MDLHDKTALFGSDRIIIGGLRFYRLLDVKLFAF